MPCETSTSPASITSGSNEPRCDPPVGPSWLEWERKPAWGWTAELICRLDYALHFLRVEAGGCCSIHRHADRDNRFLVRSGAIIVRAWGPYSETILEAGGCYDVPAGRLHQFEVLIGGSVWEVYTPRGKGATVRRDDIERLTAGRRVM